MKAKHIIITILLVTFLISSILPISSVNAASSQSITLNSALYKAIKDVLETNGVSATFNDVQYTLDISQSDLSGITELNLSNYGLSDLTGLDTIFGGLNVTSIDLSANELTIDSNLEVLNAFNLTFLDLSSNEISDVSSITNINNIETVNLHNQVFTETYVVDNSIVEEGTYKYEITLPQIIQDYGKPIQSSWLTDEYINNNKSSIKFDWASFYSTSDILKVIVGTTSGSQYNGLASLTINITDETNTLYNSEIKLYCIVIDGDQRAVVFKDSNLYYAVKEQLTAGQTENEGLTTYNNSNADNLYDYAYDKQLVLVINENDLVNKITSLILDNKKIEDLSGIEMFVGLETNLDVSSNYIDTIDRIVDLQAMKDEEENSLQSRIQTKLTQLLSRIEELEKLEAELATVISTYNSAVGSYNSYVESSDDNITDSLLAQLTIIVTQGQRYIQLTGNSVTIFGITYNSATALANLTTAEATKIDEIDSEATISGGEIAIAEEKVIAKGTEVYNTYNKLYKLASVITPELKNITDEEFEYLTLSDAKALLEAQISKITKIETYFTTTEQAWVSNTYGVIYSDDSKTPLTEYFKELLEEFSEGCTVNDYKDELTKLRNFDAYVMAETSCGIYRWITGNAGCGVENYQIYVKGLDGEDTSYLEYYIPSGKHYNTAIYSRKNIISLLSRMANASSEDVEAYITLPRLYGLDMSENLIENIDDISVMVELRSLGFGNNEIVDISGVDWSAITMLNTLDLSFNNISDITPLEVIKNLKSLDVSKNLISGSLDFSITDLTKLVDLDLSSNQIDDIEDFVSQYEYKAKAADMSTSEYILSYYEKLSLENQILEKEITITQTGITEKVDLPAIFNQLEKLQWAETTFGINSWYGNASSDGKYVILYTKTTGTKTAEVYVEGTGIGAGTVCSITYNVVAPETEEPNNPEDPTDTEDVTISFSANGGSYEIDNSSVTLSTDVAMTNADNVVVAGYAWSSSADEEPTSYTAIDNIEGETITLDVNEAGSYYLWVTATDSDDKTYTVCSEAFVVTAKQDNTDNNPTDDPGDDTPDDTEITISINTDSENISSVKEVDEVYYIITNVNTTVAEILEDVTLNTDKYTLAVKDADLDKTFPDSSVLMTNQTISIDGLDNTARCIIVVKGDVNADGVINFSDVLLLNQYRLEKEELTTAEFLAGNVIDSDEVINMSDILQLNQYRLGKISEL